MIANAAFLAGLDVRSGGLAGRQLILAPIRQRSSRTWRHIWRRRADLRESRGCLACVARWLFLRDAGRQLTHIDRQLRNAPGPMTTSDGTSRKVAVHGRLSTIRAG